MDPLDFRRQFLPTLQALNDLKGSARISELNKRVADIMKLNEQELSKRHNARHTVFEYRAYWARSYLKKVGTINNPSLGLWILEPEGRSWLQFSSDEVIKRVAETRRDSDSTTGEDQPDSDDTESWINDLLQLLQSLDPGKFERLCQRVLLESGFDIVEVTNTVFSGDGGIDGQGVLKINELLSFKVLFQCKRYAAENWVRASAIRDFRGAMQGRADKGLFITTSRFSNDAKNEAVRDGVPSIELIDGEDLCILLKKLSLGVETVEMVSHKTEFFEKL